MRFVGVRTLENQAALMHHKAREMLVAQRTQLINALRGHLAEIGVIAAQGLKNARELATVIMTDSDERYLPVSVLRLPRSCVNCTLWIGRSRAAIEPSLRWLEATKPRAA
jgi:transposase